MRRTSRVAAGRFGPAPRFPGLAAAAQHRGRIARGAALIWAIVVMTMLFSVACLAVDWGLVQLARGQLQTSVDAAALYGVRGLDQSTTVARQRVMASLTENKVNGAAISEAGVTIEFGDWNAVKRQFTVLSGRAQERATAMRLTVSLNGDNGVRTLFASLFGRSTVDIKARATATRGIARPVYVDARGSPWLAGMPNGSGVKFTGSTHLRWAPDASYAPDCSPVYVEIPVVPGQVMYFRDIGGSTGDYNSGRTYSLEGNLGRAKMSQAPANGINTTYAPLNALMGIFLDDRRPDHWAMQQSLDFSTQASRDFETLAPGLKQVFFIGDGLNNDNSELQRFVVPPDATRLYLGVSDELGFWWDNFGGYETTIFYGGSTLVE